MLACSAQLEPRGTTGEPKQWKGEATAFSRAARLEPHGTTQEPQHSRAFGLDFLLEARLEPHGTTQEPQHSRAFGLDGVNIRIEVDTGGTTWNHTGTT